MKLTVLGSGSLLSKDKACSGYLIETRKNKVAVDLGSGSFLNLKKTADIKDVNCILLTHLHSDHASDLPVFILARRLLHLQGISQNQLLIIGPKGTQKFVKSLDEIFPVLKEVPFLIKVKEMENNSLLIPGFSVKSRQVKHFEEAIAFRLEAENKSIVFSGDTAKCDAITSIAGNADLLVLECSLPDNTASDSHLHPSECASIASQAKPKQLLLTHFYPSVETEPLEKIIKEKFKGRVFLAKDLLSIQL